MIPQGKMMELDNAASWAGATEEFLAQIHRSSELLSQDRQDEARRLLESAFDSRTDDESGQATLALVYFKLGIYSRSAALYRRLTDKYPNEPTLRLNLGLVYLKTGQLDKAVAELETAVNLAPDYRKANGYLGLAYERLGDFENAKRSFSKANIKHLVERVARKSDPVPQSAAIGAEAHCGSLDLSYAKTLSDGAGGGHGEEDEVADSLARFVSELPFSEAAPSSLETKRSRGKEPVSVSELAAEAALPKSLSGRFLISEAGYLLMDVDSRGFSRLEGLRFVSADQLSYRPLKRKYRGRDCEEIFGEGKNAMFDLQGTGRLGFHPGNKVFSAVTLNGDSAYIREELLFALDPELTYENGRIPGDGSMLIHARGSGALVLKTPTEPRSLEVTSKRGVIVPSGDLVGWFGRLLPRTAKASPFSPELNALEIVGEGILLVCLSAQ